MKHADFHALLREPSPAYLPHLSRVLTYAAAKGVLPEILRYVREDQVENFLLAFGGQTVTFPTWHHVAELARDALILQLNSEVTKQITPMHVAAEKLGMNRAELRIRAEALERVYPMEADVEPTTNARPNA